MTNKEIIEEAVKSPEYKEFIEKTKHAWRDAAAEKALYCQHRNDDKICKWTCKKCDSCVQNCLYYKIYEEGHTDGYSEGKIGEDL